MPVVIPIRGTRDRWPRNTAGDPDFTTITGLHTVFTDEQIVAMCNRYLKQHEYQDAASREYAIRQRAKVAQLRSIAKELYPKMTWDSLTNSMQQKVYDEWEKRRHR